ncbi:MAG: ABC transporter substrate-binding protein [Bacteroidales bacterium]|nr:ABC transporter substrate-binding protein [Bacteroidales bacterium]
MHTFIVKISKLIIVFICVYALLSCSEEEKNNDKKIFKYNESAGISTLDPAFAKDQALIWACNQLYNGLVQLDGNLNIVPCIAKSWTINEDRTSYTFILRNDVFFHNDSCFAEPRKVTADDFVYSFNRILDDKTASPGVWIFEHIKKEINPDGTHDFSDGIKAINDTTLKIKLNEPFAPFLGLLSMPYACVVPKEAVEKYKEDFRKHPVGTGAFKFKFWKEGVKLVLLRNENYFEKDDESNRLPYLDGINISFIVDKQSVFLEFIKGNIDFISGIDPNYKDEILTHKGTLQPKYKDKINLLRQPYLNTEYLGFYLGGSDKENVLNNKYLRQAINYGFDRRKMVKYLRNNIGIAGEKGIIPPSLLSDIDEKTEGYSYNPQKAKELLEKSGYNKSKPVITLTTTSAYSDLCKYIQQQLTSLGMNVKLETNPAAELRERMSQGKSSWFRGSWIADYPDAENYLSLFYSKNFAPTGPNYTHFHNQRYDRLYEASVREIDEKKRKELYNQMNNIIIDEAPVVILYYDEVLRFTQKSIHNLSSNAMNLLTLKYVYKD